MKIKLAWAILMGLALSAPSASSPPSIQAIETEYARQITEIDSFCKRAALHSLEGEVSSGGPSTNILQTSGLLRVSVFSRNADGIARGVDVLSTLSVTTRSRVSEEAVSSSGARAYALMFQVQGNDSWQEGVFYERLSATNTAGAIIGFQLIVQSSDQTKGETGRESHINHK
jgi:hypothetical protein